jgi:hypothetical protein
MNSVPLPEVLFVPSISQLSFIDVLGANHDQSTRDLSLAQLAEIHLKYFPDHAHVVDEWTAHLTDSNAATGVIRHAWLVVAEHQPVGEFVIHVNVSRGSIVIHFVALDAEQRLKLPRTWLQETLDSIIAYCQLEAGLAGVDLLVAICESDDAHLARWESLGFQGLAVDYQEPRHGSHWADFGEPTFFPMTPCVRFLGTGSTQTQLAAAHNGVQSFLIDHYGLTESEPTVIRTRELLESLFHSK